MNHADAAVANAIKLEVKKDGLTQRQSGDWQLRFTVQHTDMDDRLARAAMGTRFVAVLVEINDDETPVEHKAEERDKWRALGPAKQAGIRCHDPIFWAFIREEYGVACDSEQIAARVVRDLCGVSTRSDLGKPGFSDQRVLWFDVDMKFQAWKAKENG